MFTETDILIFDGACGTGIQRMNLPESAWGEHPGCNEFLNVSSPESVVALHRQFIEAGANVLETNTFGANAIVLGEYGLNDRAEELARAGVDLARTAIGSREDVYVAGSIGPGTKLPSLGHISVADLVEGYRPLVEGLVAQGVDLLFIETCQDLLQAKAITRLARDVCEKLGRDVPIGVSVTMEPTGTMLVGADIASVVATFEPLGLFSLGINCATGPANMASHIHYLRDHWPARISMVPNAGMPEVVDGQTCYSLPPETFADQTARFVRDHRVSIVGGCCGTTPEHIAALARALEAAAPGGPEAPTPAPALASGYQAVPIRQEIPPLVIGERNNAHGSKLFRQCLQADDTDAAVALAVEQERSGAHTLDLCVAYAGRDEAADLVRYTRLLAESCKAPLVLDSTTPDALAAALAVYPGRPVINSVNLEDGGATMDRVCRLALRHGAAVVALTIDEDGMAMSADRKLAVARRLVERARSLGLRPQDLLIDPLTFTIGSGEQNTRDAGIQTLEALRRIRAELPGVHTVLGLSNISFGLPPAGRRVLNSVFLHEAVEAGMDAAIIHAGKILPLAKISDDHRELALNLIHDRPRDDGQTPLEAFIEAFVGASDSAGTAPDARLRLRPAEALREKVLNGDKQDLPELITVLLETRKPVQIINELLLPAMQRVGVLFGAGEMLLPFVLQSAETMKAAVGLLEPHMEAAESESGLNVLLATVEGDVHDIGKNLVNIILSNNGYRVHDLGIKVPAETIIDRARELKVDAIGLSGLLVKSALAMQALMPRLAEAGLSVPVLLGGAALSDKFVAESCATAYAGPVVHCPDAFAGLKALREHEASQLVSTTYQPDATEAVEAEARPAEPLSREHPVPEPPFAGVRYQTDVAPSDVLPYINEPALFHWRWGYKRAGMDEAQWEQLLTETIRPAFQDLLRQSLHEGLVQPRVAWGYFRCHADGDALIVQPDQAGPVRLEFARQQGGSRLCLADYFRGADEGGDVAGFMLVSVAGPIGQRIREHYEADRYSEYLHLHGFSVELTEALAEFWHARMRRELGIAAGEPAADGHEAIPRRYQGQRYAVGYPAWPNLEDQRRVFELLRPGEIGVELTEGLEMVPEQSTSAIVVHHPQARYFAV